MNARTSMFFAVLLLSIALVAWAAVGLLTYSVINQTAARASGPGPADQSVTQQIAATRAHAVVQNMAKSKAELERMTGIDLLTAINRIESAGKPVGIVLHVRDAYSESFGKQAKGPIHAIAFAVEAEGTFAGLIKTIQLLETMPMTISIEQFDFGHTPSIDGKPSSRTPWHLSIRIRLLTTSNIIS